MCQVEQLLFLYLSYFHKAAIKRAKVFAPYADLLWVETSTPTLSVAKHFIGKIKEAYPDKSFVYNLSPSFNWSKFGFTGKAEQVREQEDNMLTLL